MKASRRRTKLGVSVLGAAVVVLGPLLLSVPAGAAAPARTDLPGTRPPLPAGAHVTGSVPSAVDVSADVVLEPRDPAALAAAVSAVSTPGSPTYQQFLAPGQFGSLYGPTPAAISAVRAWLASEGLDVGTTSPDGLLIPVSGSAATMATAFATPLESVQLASGASATLTAGQPSVAASLVGIVQGVSGLDTTAHLRPHIVTTTEPAPRSASPEVTPSVTGPTACSAGQATGGPVDASQLANAYGLNTLYGQGLTGVGVGVAIMEFEQVDTNDLLAFGSCYGLTINPTFVPNNTAGGPIHDAESALDIEAVAALAPSAHLYVYEAQNSSNNQLTMLEQIANADTAKVVTTSWGECEQDLPPNFAAMENTQLAKMAMQGQTFVAASGDTGSSDCYGTDGGQELSVDDPGSQPYAVSAGGTELLSTSGPTGETVWNSADGAGGGGSSIIWPRSSFQPALAAGREVPDVSSDADPATGLVIYAGGWELVGGTSVAAPTWASVFALLDQSKVQLGWADPSLYAMGCNPAAFTDVTSSVSGASDNAIFPSTLGQYAANPGYDMASGWGSPKAPGLLADWGQSYSCAGLAPAQGYRMVATDGGIFAFNAPFYGSTGGQHLNAPIVGTAPDTATGGYWLVASDGGVFAFNAPFYGSMGNKHLNKPIVGMAAEPGGGGYWLVASDGGIFAFGTAPFEGSTGSLHLNAPIVGMAPTTSGGGYWLVAADGGIFAFNAIFSGSMGGKHLNAPIVGMSTSPGSPGYRMVAADGGIFTFGGAPFYGSPAATGVSAPVVGMSPDPQTGGYWITTSAGDLYAYNAPSVGSMTGLSLNEPVVAVASR